MTVQELINELILACGGRDPSQTEVKKVVVTSESAWGYSEDWEDTYVDSAGGINYPLVVLIKWLSISTSSVDQALENLL